MAEAQKDEKQKENPTAGRSGRPASVVVEMRRGLHRNGTDFKVGDVVAEISMHQALSLPELVDFVRHGFAKEQKK